MTINLPEIARECSEGIARAFPHRTREWRRAEATLKLAEELGEAVGAMLRFNDMTRRTGTSEELAFELADVVISAYRCAHVHGIELDRAIADKAEIILSRGFRDPR